VRNNRRLMVAGAVSGLLLAIVQQWYPHWSDSAALVVAMIVAVVLLTPLAAYIGYSLYVLNVREPQMTVVIPTQWRRLLQTPAGPNAALLAHELSHMRHRDALRRRFVSFYSTGALLLTFLEAAAPGGVTGSTVGTAVSFGSMAAGLYAIRRARRSVPLLQELRADAEASRDPAAARDLAAGLGVVQSRTPTHGQEVRLRALGGDGPERVLAAARRTVYLSTLGFVLPVLGCLVYVLVRGGPTG
jgi:Peptidase family M48